jgi:aspartate/methionine/tyrosine aminotransferase
MANNYFPVIQNRLRDRKLQLQKMLKDTGIDYVDSYAGYFVLADVEKINFPYDPNSSVPRDHQLCRWLPATVGLMAIPPSVFYSKDHKKLAEKYMRLAFCKRQETLDNAKEGFDKLRKYMN